MSRSRKKKNENAQPADSDATLDELSEAILEEGGIAQSFDTDISDAGSEVPVIRYEQRDSPPAVPDATSKEDDSDEVESLESLDQYKRESPFSRIIPTVIGIAIAGLIVSLVVGVWLVSQMLGARSEAEEAQKSFQSIQESITNLDFRSALQEFPKGEEKIKKLQDRVSSVRFLSFVPWVGPQIEETHTALQTIRSAFSAGEQLLSLVSSAGDIIFRKSDGKTFDVYMKTLSIEEKGKILQVLVSAQPTLQGVQATLKLVVEQTDHIQTALLSNQLRHALFQTRDGARNIQSLIAAWEPLAPVMPSFLGYPNERVYLILLQDTSQARATGGFISHYGILKFHNGQITYLRTDNVYNLDDKATTSLLVAPPQEFHTYFKEPINTWLLRDSNWSPDFSESALRAEDFYYREGGREKRIDGVLAATPELIKALLTFTGSIRIEGREYTADSFMEQLAFEVREGNYRRGIAQDEQKEIFGTLIAHIGTRLLDLPLTSWIELYKTMETRLNEKHMLVYFHDPLLQNFAAERNWTGSIQETDGDYLMVVDSTLATLNTESVMRKKVTYTVREDPDGFFVGHVDLEYENRGTFSDVTTRYRDWVRILVPSGSTLVRVKGAQGPEGSDKEGPLEVRQEHDKIQFGAFITVEPRHKKVFSIEYRLPDRIAAQARSGRYSLLLQKQPGDSNKEFAGLLSFMRPIVSYEPLGFFNARRGSGALNIFSDFRTDEQFILELGK